MNQLFQNLLEQLSKSNRQTKVTIAACLAMVLSVAGALMWRSANPSMSLLYSDMDQVQFGKVAGALAGAGVRFRDSGPHAPYSIWVADADRSQAMLAVHGEGAMQGTPLGIQTGIGGAASAFLGHAEREQLVRKRNWEEAKKAIEKFAWIRSAELMSSTGRSNVFGKTAPETVAVIIELQGIDMPDREQSRMVAMTVRNIFNVPLTNVVVVEAAGGRKIFDGSQDSEADMGLDFVRDFERTKTLQAQRFLDQTFGPGLAMVEVSSDFDHQKFETLDETIDPGKIVVAEETSKSSTPVQTRGGAGGPATTATGSVAGSGAPAGSDPLSTSSETRKEYTQGRKTTYQKQSTPVLKRLSIALVLDQSLADRLGEAEELIKSAVGFQADRGDTIQSMAQALPGLERDENGAPVPPAPLEPTPQANPMMAMLLERGIEIVAAVVFLMLLLKSLKKSNTPIVEKSENSLASLSEEEIDMDALARRHVEELLAKEPERVGALLSRWALGDDYFMRSSR